MSLTPSRKPSTGQRRRSMGTSGGGRYSRIDASNTHTYPGRARGVEGSSPTAQTYPPSTPRRQAKSTACTDNHGIRTPAPEQYLTPLQQKEVCIRHLRSRLRENAERLQHRDFEIDELKTQLCRMQEDWIEEECHRVEAQLALKDARREIHHLQGVVGTTVRTNLNPRGEQHDPHDRKPYPTGLQVARPGGKSRSCGCSPAGTLSRSAARLSGESLQLERTQNAPPDLSGASPRPEGRTHLLLEAALLSEQLAPPPPGHHHVRGGPPVVASSVPRSSTYEKLCSGGAVLPVSHSCHTLSSSSCRCHAYLPHHHLFLHLPQEEVPPAAVPPPVTVSIPVPVPAPVAESKPEVRSQACSPTMTWLSEEGAGEELSVISLATADTCITPSELRSFPPSLPASSWSTLADGTEPLLPSDRPPMEPVPAVVQTRQPGGERQEATVVEMEEDRDEEEEGGNEEEEEGGAPQRCHWSRYFLIDLLALAMPVVPTVAWMCRRAPRDAVPMYHIGSLLRGCCAVALHSLRRRGAGGGRGGPVSMNGAVPI